MTTDLDLSPEAVEQALIELREATECRCEPAYTDRGLHSHECLATDRLNVEIISATITRLLAERDAAWQAGAEAMREAAAQKAAMSGSIVDYPSVFMGGPSRNAVRIAAEFARSIRSLPLPSQPKEGE